MRYHISNVRAGTLRGRRIAPAVLTLMLLAGSVLLAPSHVRGGPIPPGPVPPATEKWGDDENTSKLNPDPLRTISSITYAGHPELTGQSSWITASLDAYKAANADNGTGPTREAWKFTWAGVAQEKSVEKGITIRNYYPYVVTPPRVASVPGSAPVTTRNPQGIASVPQQHPSELGGAVLNLTYTPGLNDAPVIPNLHWIQAYTGTLEEGAVPTLLDNAPGKAYQKQANNLSPFYDAPKRNGRGYIPGTVPGPGYSAGTLTGGGGWFIDRPVMTEAEFEGHPVASVQFQVVLASDNRTRQANGVWLNDVTLYGGEWWGFTYDAVETPEPASFLLMAVGGGGLFFFRRMTARMRIA